MNLRTLLRLMATALLAAGLAAAGTPPKPAPLTADSGFTLLFNGHDMNGWQHAGDGSFSIENGELVSHGGMGLLWYSRKKFTNYVLRVTYRETSNHDNSGVFIKIGPDQPSGPQGAWYGVNHGYEIQIDDHDNEFHRTGCVYSMVRCGVNSKPWGQWNLMEIRVHGRTINVFMNGKQVTHFVETQPVPPKKEKWEPDRHLRPLSGYIGLQNHGGDVQVHFRKVEIKELP